jgi:DUF2075 family protein/DNA replication protein DnaC
MLVYTSTKAGFRADVIENRIERVVLDAFRNRLGRSTSSSEISAWSNSMLYMNNVLQMSGVPDDCGVAIEYRIPQTSKRIDFILTGQDSGDRDTAIIVELKQWSEVEPTMLDGIVATYFNGVLSKTAHPSYQAWTYAALLQDFNETVYEGGVALQPCAYAHNCADETVLRDARYRKYTKLAPIYLKEEERKLSQFISKHVRRGDRGKLLYQIDHGRIRPSKNLADHLASLLSGKPEFVMIDDQKLVYEQALDLAQRASEGKKHVLIVSGGPGTGKTVVAVNLLVELIKRSLSAQYVTRNAAPREVYRSKLAGTFTKTRIANLFRGSGAFTETERNEIDVLIVDEAHRLNEKSGLYKNEGENQIKEIIETAKFSVFFVDERQKVTLNDIGDLDEIKKWANSSGANIVENELTSQFRCNGSDGFLAWIDNTLQIRETANESLDAVDFDFQVCDTASELRDRIFEKNDLTNRARIVAGYCWPWASKKDSDAFDIEFPQEGFAMQWNLTDDGSLWILKAKSVEQIGCIHTCQGLELQYVGVIVGPDFIVRDGHVIARPEYRAKQDSSMKGYKALKAKSPEQAQKLADEIIKNTYRTLMTRGTRGCYIYCTDPETNLWFKSRMASQAADASEISDRYPGLRLRVLLNWEAEPYQNCVPIYDLHVAAGSFSDEQVVEDHDWVELPPEFRIQEGMFVTRVVGESMNRRIPNGAWCLFRSNPVGTRDGKIVLVQHRHINDSDTGGHFTVKVYHSEKVAGDDAEWQHRRITLTPDTTANGNAPIVIEGAELDEFKVLGEFIAVL